MKYEGAVYRPPGEWRSFLLQATIGCSHNACTFCGMYKDKEFRIRPLDEILADIDETAAQARSYDKIFICDGDAIAMPMEHLLTILEKLKASFPNVRLISTYAGPQSTLSKTPEELKTLAQAGLGRAYLGIESGDDRVLRDTCKGVSRDEMLLAGQRIVESGMELWGIILVGLGGRSRSNEHITATADIINQMKPQHLSAMTYTPVPGTRLYQDVVSRKFEVLDAEECLMETRTLLENIKIDNIHFTSDHASNYLPLKGTISRETPRLIGMIDEALGGSRKIRGEFTRGL